ncbi:DUF1003 domain-containing protein [Streptomyces sp. AJS327]|uniref:DUF1003 domain-containing protein n=1 Tax=Streptomyces sp. AJS327 TaxID=2545265 RepID=UPI0015DE37E6|nr:DUF1003 domain-containing protein [Streptomyces sp. AJS327]MBA0051431.1 DUF1003 domain-containing protein [Streptomyces sp. AJS327]
MAERNGEREREERTREVPGAQRPRIRLDLPQVRRRSLLPEYDPDAFGRLSEKIARFLGTGRFIVWMTVVIALWVLWNVALPRAARFDEYPFIFLTLALSLQASYAAPLILLAQNRQDDRDRVNLEQDRKQNERSIADTEFLTREIAALRMGLGEVATRDWIRSELQVLMRELERDTWEEREAERRHRPPPGEPREPGEPGAPPSEPGGPAGPDGTGGSGGADGPRATGGRAPEA